MRTTDGTSCTLSLPCSQSNESPVTKLRDGPGWIYEIKLDGYRAIAVKADGRVNVFSRRRKSFDHHYALIVEALGELPEGAVVDGEIVALDDSGRPDFQPAPKLSQRSTAYPLFHLRPSRFRWPRSNAVAAEQATRVAEILESRLRPHTHRRTVRS